MTYTDPGAQHYAPTIATDHNLFTRHDTAHALAGLDAPTRSTAIRALLDAEPTADALARELAAGVLEADDAAAWLEDALTRMQRAHAADTLRTALGRHRDTTIREHADRLTAETVAAIRPAFDRTVKTLTKAAAKLPTDGRALDLEAVVALDATKEMKEAQRALTDLAAFAAVHKPLHPRDLPARAVRLLAVVDVPEVPVEQVNRVSGNPVDQHDQRDTLRAFLDTAERHGEDQALIGVARGAYPGLSLHLAESNAALRENLHRAHVAIQRKPVDAGHTVHVA